MDSSEIQELKNELRTAEKQETTLLTEWDSTKAAAIVAQHEEHSAYGRWQRARDACIVLRKALREKQQ